MSIAYTVLVAWLAASACAVGLLVPWRHLLERHRITGQSRRRGGYIKLHALPDLSPAGTCTTGLTLIRGVSTSSPSGRGGQSEGAATRPLPVELSRLTGLSWSGSVTGDRGVSGLPPDSVA